jgi:uncharacterized protein (UPF0147 family)
VRGEQAEITRQNVEFEKIQLTGEIVPQVQLVDESVPANARRYLQQAIDSVYAPDGAAMLANSAIDAMLKARGLTDGSVFSRLKLAVSQGLLTEEIRNWADIVRNDSNNPRHADDEIPHVTADRARLLIESPSNLRGSSSCSLRKLKRRRRCFKISVEEGQQGNA